MIEIDYVCLEGKNRPRSEITFLVSSPAPDRL